MTENIAIVPEVPVEAEVDGTSLDRSLLDTYVREGARRMLQADLDAEVRAFSATTSGTNSPATAGGSYNGPLRRFVRLVTPEGRESVRRVIDFSQGHGLAFESSAGCG